MGVALLFVLLVNSMPSHDTRSESLESQRPVYWLRVDRANQRISLRGPRRERIPFLVQRPAPDGTPIRQKVYWLPARTKTVRFISPEGPKIPNDPYGKYCELPPADGIDGMYYTVGPIEEINPPSGSFGFYAIPLKGKPADLHGRTGLLIHGGGNKLPDPFADYQGWQCTHGCVKMQNADLRVLVDTLRALPADAEVRCIVDGGKCKLNDMVGETYRWDESSKSWIMLDQG